MCGQRRLGLEHSDGWNPARATAGRGKMRSCEGCGEPVPLQVPFHSLVTDPAATPVMSHCSLSSTSLVARQKTSLFLVVYLTFQCLADSKFAHSLYLNCWDSGIISGDVWDNINSRIVLILAVPLAKWIIVGNCKQCCQVCNLEHISSGDTGPVILLGILSLLSKKEAVCETFSPKFEFCQALWR